MGSTTSQILGMKSQGRSSVNGKRKSQNLKFKLHNDCPLIFHSQTLTFGQSISHHLTWHKGTNWGEPPRTTGTMMSHQSADTSHNLVPLGNRKSQGLGILGKISGQLHSQKAEWPVAWLIKSQRSMLGIISPILKSQICFMPGIFHWQTGGKVGRKPHNFLLQSEPFPSLISQNAPPI